MGLFGSLGHKALNQAGIMLLGVDYDRQKERRQAQEDRNAWASRMPVGLIGGQAAAAQSAPKGPGLDGEPVAPAAAPSPKVPTLQDALPWIMQGIQMGDPRAAEYLSAIKGAQPPGKTALNTSQGPREYDPATGGYRILEDFPDKPAPAPSGWRWNGDKLEYIPNGPADPKYIGQTAGIRREAVVSRPTPSRAKAGGSAAAGVPPLPSGFIMEK
jgi:hypothetical protein